MPDCKKYPTDVAVFTPGAVTMDHGRQVRAAETASSIKASVQPVTGFELLQVPEADRNRRHLDLFTQDTLQKGDLVEPDGFPGRFEIRNVQDWRETKLAHLEARAVQIDAA